MMRPSDDLSIFIESIRSYKVHDIADFLYYLDEFTL